MRHLRVYDSNFLAEPMKPVLLAALIAAFISLASSLGASPKYQIIQQTHDTKRSTKLLLQWSRQLDKYPLFIQKLVLSVTLDGASYFVCFFGESLNEIARRGIN